MYIIIYYDVKKKKQRKIQYLFSIGEASTRGPNDMKSNSINRYLIVNDMIVNLSEI